MLKDYQNREHEIGIIDHIITATMDKGDKYFDNWEEEQYIMQWLYNQRQGDVLEPLSEEDITLIMYIIADGCDESVFYETMIWLVNHVDLEDGGDPEDGGNPGLPPAVAPYNALSISELWEIDGEPVWCSQFGWRICYGITDFRGYLCMETGTGGCISMNGYGETWLAYRRKPECGTPSPQETMCMEDGE